MNIKKKESSGDFEKDLYTGIFSGKCIAINPDKSELSTILGFDLEDEPTYEGKDAKGNEFVALSFWLQPDLPDFPAFNARFRLVDVPMMSEKTGKQQYINQTGGSGWADKKENLQEWFTKFQKEEPKKSGKYVSIANKIVRESIQGEAQLYIFLRALLGKVSFYDIETDIMIDKKSLFRNVDKYVKDKYLPLIKAKGEDSLVTPVVALATVYTSEKDGEIKKYQNLYQEYLGAYTMKNLSFAIASNNWSDKSVKKWHEQLIGEYGCKDVYTLTMLQKFDPSAHQQSSGEKFIDKSSEPEIVIPNGDLY